MHFTNLYTYENDIYIELHIFIIIIFIICIYSIEYINNCDTSFYLLIFLIDKYTKFHYYNISLKKWKIDCQLRKYLIERQNKLIADYNTENNNCCNYYWSKYPQRTVMYLISDKQIR